MNWQDDIDSCISMMENDGIILYPTDTIWGLGCDATNEKAVEKIFQLKQRPPKKSMIILVPDETWISQYVNHVEEAVLIFIQTLTKPTTIIYDEAKGLASNLINEDGSIAIRIVQDEFCKDLLHQYKKPIVSTSANLSGQPSPAIYKEIDPQIKSGVDYIVQHRQTDETLAAPSSIIKWNKGNTPTIIR